MQASFKDHRLTSLDFMRRIHFVFICTETDVEFNELLLILVSLIFCLNMSFANIVEFIKLSSTA